MLGHDSNYSTEVPTSRSSSEEQVVLESIEEDERSEAEREFQRNRVAALIEEELRHAIDDVLPGVVKRVLDRLEEELGAGR